MWIDLAWLLLMVLAIFKGLRQGFLLAVFSAIAFVVGLAAAIKLSATVAAHLMATAGSHAGSGSAWTRAMPVIAFVLVFLAVVLGVRWAAKLVEKLVDLAMMGWLNRLAGILLYAALYTVILSVCLFYAVQSHIISAKTLSASISYGHIKLWGPVVIEGFGKFIPWFKGMFAELEAFFGDLPNRL